MRLARHVHLDECACQVGDRGQDLALGQRGPADQVGHRRRAVAGEEPLHHRADGVVAVQRRGRGDAVVEQCVGVLPVDQRARADQTFQLGDADQLPESLALEVLAADGGDELPPRQRTLLGQEAQQPVHLAPDHGGILEPQVATARGHRAEHLRPGQVEQPSHVLRGDVVPRRAQHVGADHVAGVDRLADDRVRCPARAHRQRPARQGCVLRLDGQQVAYGVGRVGVRRTDQPLGGKPPRQHVVEVHRGSLPRRAPVGRCRRAYQSVRAAPGWRAPGVDTRVSTSRRPTGPSTTCASKSRPLRTGPGRSPV